MVGFVDKGPVVSSAMFEPSPCASCPSVRLSDTRNGATCPWPATVRYSNVTSLNLKKI